MESVCHGLRYLGNNEQLAKVCLLLGSQNLLFIVSLLIFSSISFFFNILISAYVVIIALLASIIWCWWISKRYFNENCQIHSILFVLLFLTFCLILYSCIAVSGHFFDLSWDGQAYHQETIIHLMSGWNPVYSDISDELLHSIWTNHYSKGAEINAVALSTVVSSIEECKALNIFLIITTFLISFATIVLTSQRIKLSYALVFGFLIAMNPVSICQSLSFYVDGQLASLVSCLICLIFLANKKIDVLVLICLISTIIVLLNVKFLGLIYALIISLGFMVWISIYQKERSLLILKCLLFSFLFGILVIGYNPYITNSIDHGNPFYPVFGSDFDVLTSNTPANFQNVNSFTNLFISIFSHSMAGVTNSTYKMPFTITIDDLEAFQTPDVRLSGFGPLFSGAIVISIFNLFRYFKSNIRYALNNQSISLKLLIILLLLISVLVNPSSWWARFAPQLWLIPLFLSLFISTVERKPRWVSILNILLIYVLVINVLLISSVYFHSQINGTEAMNEQLDSLSSVENEKIKIKFSETYSNRIRLKEKGIIYEEVEELNSFKPLKLLYSDTQIYLVNST